MDYVCMDERKASFARWGIDAPVIFNAVVDNDDGLPLMLIIAADHTSTIVIQDAVFRVKTIDETRFGFLIEAKGVLVHQMWIMPISEHTLLLDYLESCGIRVEEETE